MSDEQDENEEQLHPTSNPDDIFVAAAGTSLTTRLNTDSLTDDVCTNKIDKTPQETAESPVLFFVDNTEQDTCTTNSTTTPNSGRKPAKLMDVNIPPRNPTQPT